jgi:hypothetical protein
MVVAELEEVQYDLEIDGEPVREQLARQVWERGGWATVALVFRERDRDGEWKPAKLALLRFRRIREVWKKQASITLTGEDAKEMIGVLLGWKEMLG